jgi:hypothetical protein
MQIQCVENGYSLMVDGEEFEMVDGGFFEVNAARLKGARLSDLPDGCSVVLCDRVVGSRDLYCRSPNCTFEHAAGRFYAHAEVAFVLDGHEDIEPRARKEWYTASIAKGRKALAPLAANGVLLKVEESVHDEIAYLLYSLEIADQSFPDAEAFMAAIENRVLEGLERPLMFICHASEDKAFVEKLVVELDFRALHAWFDQREILVGDSIVEKINLALKETRYVVVVLSKRSVNKPWVRRELGSSLMRQLSNEGVLLLPVLLDECEIPPLLADIKYADFTRSFDKGLLDLLCAIRR